MDYEEMDKTYAKKKKDIVQEWIDEGIKIGRRQAVDEIEKGIMKLKENIKHPSWKNLLPEQEILSIVRKAGGGE